MNAVCDLRTSRAALYACVGHRRDAPCDLSVHRSSWITYLRSWHLRRRDATVKPRPAIARRYSMSIAIDSQMVPVVSERNRSALHVSGLSSATVRSEAPTACS